MFKHSESPPPLHHSPAPSDQSSFASRDCTPTTPVDCDSNLSKRPDKDRDQRLPWFKRPIDIGKPTTRLSIDNTLLEPDFEDSSFPLFGETPSSARSMAGTAAPIDIATRQASTSPRGPQPSNLTSALRKSPESVSAPHRAGHIDTLTNGSRYDSNSKASARLDNGAVPIFPGDKPRRESIAQSLGTGMSWGGVSVGSWIRDE
jgi:transcription factor SFP1